MKLSNEQLLRVLKTVAEADATDTIWWRCDGEYAPITVFVACNDFFWWGTADCEEVTPDNLEVFEQAFQDAAKVHYKKIDLGMYGGLLFCARTRQMRPQGAYYNHLPAEIWPLFDACGPKREVDFANPEEQP